MNEENLKKQYEAEARFLRALCYFNIVRFWGAAPLILSPMTATEVAECERNSVADIYSAIEDDILFASDASNLPKSFNGDDSGRATSIAAKALLGKVYLQEKKWVEAQNTLGTLIHSDNGGIYGLLSDITNVFSTAPEPGSSTDAYRDYTNWIPQIMNKEILFEVLYSKDIAGEGRNALTYYANQADINEELKISNTERCIYDPADRRADLMRSMRGTNTDNNLLVKYADIVSSLGTYEYPTPILRWSDVLLMYAEACNEVAFDNSENSAALIALNEVRTRSFADGAYHGTDLPDQDAFREAIFLERRLEFPMEMQRWFDLLRSGEAINAISQIGITIDENDLLYPIPNSEVELRNDSEKFPQNPGY